VHVITLAQAAAAILWLPAATFAVSWKPALIVIVVGVTVVLVLNM